MGRHTGILEPTKTDLTQEQVRGLFSYDPDSGVLRWKKPRYGPDRSVAGVRHSGGYLSVGINYQHYLVHRVIWLYVHGEHPPEIDHLNGIRNDNRLVNLRACPRTQNQQNAKLRKDNQAGIPGVNYNARVSRWQVRIQHDNVRYFIGLFERLEDAVAARKAAQETLKFGPNCGAKHP